MIDIFSNEQIIQLSLRAYVYGCSWVGNMVLFLSLDNFLKLKNFKIFNTPVLNFSKICRFFIWKAPFTKIALSQADFETNMKLHKILN